MWESKPYEQRYLPDVLEMSEENYGADNDICNGAFLQHQYFENPAGDAIMELAVDPANGRLAGQYVVAPARFMCFGEEVPCVLSLNTLTREAYRGQGIFTGLAARVYQRAEEEGYNYVYTSPNPNSYPGFMRKLSFEEIHHFPLYVRPLDPSQMVKEKLGSGFLSALAKPFGLLFPCRNKQADSIVKLTKDNSEIMDEFWQQIKGKYQVMVLRDAKYIRYRYLDMPRRIYHPYVAMSNGKPVAFAVGRVREVAGFQCGMIADFLFINGFEEQARSLIHHVVYQMKEAGASLAGCAILAHTEEARQLKKCGFLRCPDFVLPQPTPLLIRIFNEKLREKGITDIQNWFFTAGDYDTV